MLNALSNGFKRLLTNRREANLTESPRHEAATPSTMRDAPTPVKEQITTADTKGQAETTLQPPAQAPVKELVPSSDVKKQLETLVKEIKVHQKSYGPKDLDRFGNDVLRNRWLVQLLRDAGREKVRNKDYDGAHQLLGAALQLNPDDPEAAFQYAVATSRMGRHRDALEKFRSIKTSEVRPARTLSEYAQALRRVIEHTGHNQSQALVIELREIVEARLQISNAKEGVLPPSIASILSRLGYVDLAERALAHTMEARPNHMDSLIVQARILTETGRVDAGLKVARQILDLDPKNETAIQMFRTFRDMSGSRQDKARFALLTLTESNLSLRGPSESELARPETNEQMIAALELSSANWVAVSSASSLSMDEDWLMRVFHAGGAGCLQLSPDLSLWKITALRDVLEAELAQVPTLWSDLRRLSRFYIRPAPTQQKGTAVLLSRYGKYKFGGGEHFLHSAAIHYQGMGYAPLILGSSERRPAEAAIDGIEDTSMGLRYGYTDMKAAALRRIIVEQNATLVHAISGMGFVTAAALGGMNIPFIYGVHYFREVFGGGDGDVFFDINEKPIPRADFSYLLSRASMVYANSAYTQNLIESTHKVRCPVIFSVPEERN